MHAPTILILRFHTPMFKNNGANLSIAPIESDGDTHLASGKLAEGILTLGCIPHALALSPSS